MSDLKERVERLYSSFPIIRPPKVINHFKNTHRHVLSGVGQTARTTDFTGRLMRV
jgi:hypothetical protein